MRPALDAIRPASMPAEEARSRAPSPSPATRRFARRPPTSPRRRTRTRSTPPRRRTARRSRTRRGSDRAPVGDARRPALGRPPATWSATATTIGTSSAACHPSADAAIAAISSGASSAASSAQAFARANRVSASAPPGLREHEVERRQHRARPEADRERAGERHRQRAADHDRDRAGDDEAPGEDARAPPAEAPFDRVGRGAGGHQPDREQRRVQRGRGRRDVELVAEVRRQRADRVQQEPDDAQVGVGRPRHPAPAEVGGRRHADRSPDRSGDVADIPWADAHHRRPLGRRHAPSSSSRTSPRSRPRTTTASRARRWSGTGSSPTAGSCSTGGRPAAGAPTSCASRASRSRSSTARTPYRWLGLTGVVDEVVDDVERARDDIVALAHRYHPEGPTASVDRRVPHPAAGHVPRPDHGRPRPPRGLTVASVKIGFLLWPQTASWPEHPRRRRRSPTGPARPRLWTWDHLNSIVGPWEGPILEGWIDPRGLVAGHRARHAGPDGRRQHVPQPGPHGEARHDPRPPLRRPRRARHRRRLVRARARGVRDRLRDRVRRAPRPARRVRDAPPPPARRRARDPRRARSTRCATRWCAPRPVQARLPIMIGGSGPKKTLRTLARYGDQWNVMGSVDKLAERDAILREHCAAVGRDQAEIERTTTVDIVIRDTHEAGAGLLPGAARGQRRGVRRDLELLRRAAGGDRRGAPADHRARVPAHLRRHAGALRPRDARPDRRGPRAAQRVTGSRVGRRRSSRSPAASAARSWPTASRPTSATGCRSSSTPATTAGATGCS